MLTLLLARGDDELGGDVPQVHVLLVAQVQGHREHVGVGDAGAADGPATLAGGLVAFQGSVANVLAFPAGQRSEHSDYGTGRIVRALELPGEELQPQGRSPRGGAFHRRRL